MVEDVMTKWGRVDILVNNAGILRDKSFAKMEWSDFVTVVNVHLMGSALCAHTVFPIMKDQEYGRIIMTSSSSGLFGNFGQTNYGAAKMGVVGLMNTLKLEGAKYNIHTNSVAPTATTRMTEHLFPAEFAEKLDPRLIIPAVVFLASEKAPNGEILEVGGGVVANTYIMETMGKYFGTDEGFNAEAVADHWSEVIDTTDAKRPFQGGDVAVKHLETIGKSES
jgi:NAD(P)-dependent dehydrogenase (short-subunit alcohol dehydrogenase family)